MIKYKGFAIAPAEVESVLARNPAVLEAAAIGVPDEIKGEAVVCFAVLKPDVRADAALDAGADVPAGLPHSRLVIACILNRSGLLRNPQVLEPGTALMTSKILAALSNWKFRPVLRGNQPVEVNAILGFNIDTSDRF